jgi:hypothetical protein
MAQLVYKNYQYFFKKNQIKIENQNLQMHYLNLAIKYYSYHYYFNYDYY